MIFRAEELTQQGKIVKAVRKIRESTWELLAQDDELDESLRVVQDMVGSLIYQLLHTLYVQLICASSFYPEDVLQKEIQEIEALLDSGLTIDSDKLTHISALIDRRMPKIADVRLRVFVSRGQVIDESDIAPLLSGRVITEDHLSIRELFFSSDNVHVVDFSEDGRPYRAWVGSMGRILTAPLSVGIGPTEQASQGRAH